MEQNLNVANIMLPGARLLYAPYGATLPADGLAAGAAWPSGWVELGYTESEVTVGYGYTKLPAPTHQTLSPVKYARTDETGTLETTLSELTAQNFALAFGTDAPTVTPAASGQVGKEEVTAGGSTDLPVYAFGLEGTYTDSAGVTRVIRFFIWKGTASKGGSLKLGNKAWVGVPLSIDMVADATKPVKQQLFKFQKILADALA